MASQSSTPTNRTVTLAEEAHAGNGTAARVGWNVEQPAYRIWDEYQLQNRASITTMIERFKNNTVPTNGYFISKHGRPETIVIPPHTNFVHFLRKMYEEHGSGKLYLPRQVAVWGSGTFETVKGQWDVVLWGGGRQKASKIKVVEVLPKNIPKTLKLISLVSSDGQDVAGNY